MKMSFIIMNLKRSYAYNLHPNHMIKKQQLSNMFTLNIIENMSGILDVSKHLNLNKPAPRTLVIKCKHLTGFRNVPKSVKYINIEESSIQYLTRGAISEGVTKLRIDGTSSINSFVDLNLPSNLKEIWCADTPVKSFDGLPYMLIDIYIRGGTMSSVDLSQYQNLKSLSLCRCRKDNQDTSIVSLPDQLTSLYLNDCNITKIENVPNSVRYLDLRGNAFLQRIEGLPGDLTKLMLPDHITTLENISHCKNLIHILMGTVFSIGDHIRNDISIQDLAIDRDEVSRMTERFIDISYVESQVRELDDTVLPVELLSTIQSCNYFDVVDGYLIEDKLDVNRSLRIVTSTQCAGCQTIRNQIDEIVALTYSQNIPFTHVDDDTWLSIMRDLVECHTNLSNECVHEPSVYSITNGTKVSFNYAMLIVDPRNMTAESIVDWWKSLSYVNHHRKVDIRCMNHP